MRSEDESRSFFLLNNIYLVSTRMGATGRDEVIQKRYGELLLCFDDLEELFKSTQLALLSFKTSILNEYRYCARALVDFNKAENYEQKEKAITRAEVAISAAYNDVVDFIVDNIKLAVTEINSKYWDRPVRQILDDHGYPSVAAAIQEANELILETRRDRHSRLSKYITFAGSSAFKELRRFSLEIGAIIYILDEGATGKERESKLVSLMNAALLNQPNVAGDPKFKLFFQPKFRFAAKSKKPAVVGAEALIRFQYTSAAGKLETLTPNQFLAIAHQAKMTERVGEWVLDAAIEVAREWRPHLPRTFDLSINVSPVELSTAGFAAEFRDKVIAAGVDDLISIELLEEWDKSDGIHSGIVSQLGELGAKTRIHIDDFGTGTTKLAYISRTNHLSSLKIDLSIVSGLKAKNRDAVARLIKGIVALAQANNLNVIAEGVESDEQLKALQELGIELFQGHHKKHFSPALDKDTFAKKYLVN